MPSRTAKELRLLRTLTTHTRAHALLLLDKHPLLVVTSGRRSARRNAQVGGSPSSFHLLGRGVDFTGPTWDLAAAAGSAWAQRVGRTCTGPEEVLLEDLGRPNQHLHVAW